MLKEPPPTAPSRPLAVAVLRVSAPVPVKKAATDPFSLTDEERESFALFVGFAAARSRNLIEGVERQHLANDPTDEGLLKLWCEANNKPFTSDTDRQLLRSSVLGAVVVCAENWQRRILTWQWHFLTTGRDAPFITSDHPAFGTRQEGYSLLTFPVSSAIAFLASDHPGVGIPGRGVEDIRGINCRTLGAATRFVVCHKDAFPGDELLADWVKRES